MSFGDLSHMTWLIDLEAKEREDSRETLNVWPEQLDG